MPFNDENQLFPAHDSSTFLLLALFFWRHLTERPENVQLYRYGLVVCLIFERIRFLIIRTIFIRLEALESC